MSALFISDLHLSPTQPLTTELFFYFVEKQAIQANAIYILGDLFESWIGDDDDHEFNKMIIDALHQLSLKNIPLHFMHGNRDFLIGKRFASQSGCQLLCDPTTITLNEKKVILMHGDSLCTQDIAYQKFRRKARNPFLQWLFLRRSLTARRKTAQHYRELSAQHTRAKKVEIMDVTPDTVITTFKQSQADVMIHGHTHRPAFHAVNVDNTNKKRIVLGAWHDQGNMLWYQPSGKFIMQKIIKQADHYEIETLYQES